MSQHELARSIEVLSRTPGVLRALLAGLSEPWTQSNCGSDTFSPFDVVGHLIHGERTDWMPRARWILAKGASEPFPPFDRFAQQRESAGKSMDDLIREFELLRSRSVSELADLRLDAAQLALTGLHPALGPVTLRQLFATWVVHDLNHLAQISRALAYRYKSEVGPWSAYLPILTR
jgi:hypothetical protein